MIELYLYIKIYLYYFPGRLKNMPNLENHRGSHFEFQFQKLLRLYHNTYILLFCMDLSTEAYRGLWFNRTHLPLFQNMSLKIYTNFFSSSGGYKINNLKDKMRHGMWVYILLNNLASSHCNTGITFGTGGQNAMKNQWSFILRYFSLKFSCEEIIKAIGLILWCNMFAVTLVFF